MIKIECDNLIPRLIHPQLHRLSYCKQGGWSRRTASEGTRASKGCGAGELQAREPEQARGVVGAGELQAREPEQARGVELENCKRGNQSKQGVW